MTTDISEAYEYSRRRKHFRGYRHLKVIFLALGLAGLVLGFALSGSYVFSRNFKLLKLGAIYVIVSLIVLGIRGIMVYVGHSRR